MPRVPRRAILIALACVVLLGAILFLSAVRAAKRMARWDAAQYNIKVLALAIELYRDEHHGYPGSMEELLSTPSAPLKEEVDRDILHNPFNDEFAFKTSPTGFAITVSSRSWLMEPKVIQKAYAPGEALK